MPLALIVATGVLSAAVISAVVLAHIVPDAPTGARREVGAFLAALLAYSLFYGVFFIQSFQSGNYIAPSDSLDFGVSAYLSSPSLWTEGIWSGYPAAADPQTLTWYPVLQMFRAVGAGWNSFLISAYVLASATMFLFVRRLTCSTLAGAFSGFVCGFSGFVVGYITNFNQIHAFAWVPLILYGLQLIREGQHRPGAAVAAVAVGLMWLAGHPQIALYATYLAVGVAVGQSVVDRVSVAVAAIRVCWTAVAIAVGMMLAAVALLPMIELGGFSDRAASSFELYSSAAMPPRELLALVMPFALGGFWTSSGGVPYLGDTRDSGYVGLLPVALALAALWARSRHRREARLWAVLLVGEVLLCLGSVTPVGWLFYYMPGYGRFQAPARHLFLVTLCLAAGSGLGFAAFTGQRDRRGVLARSVSVAALALAIAYAALMARTPSVRALMESHASYVQWALEWPLGLAGVALLLVLVGRRLPDSHRGAVAFGAVLIGFAVGDLAMLHYRWPGRQFVYADIVHAEAAPHPRMVALGETLRRTGERVLATDGSRNPFLLPNLTRAWGIPAASGTGSLGIQRYLDVLRMGGSGATEPEALSVNERGADLFSIRYALVREDSGLALQLKGQSDRWQPIESLHYSENDPDTYYTLFRNLRALPRAWCVYHAVDVSPADALTSIRDGRLPDGAEFDPGRSALVEAGALAGWKTGEVTSTGEVATDSYLQNRYVVRSRVPCLLVLSEVYYPWWRVSIDEKPAQLGRVNYTMLGVSVPAGLHVVRLSMVPMTIWIGGAISGGGLLLWVGLVTSVYTGLGRRDTGVKPA